MTSIRISAMNENGATLHTHDAATVHEAAGYICRNAQASFVDGFTVEGIGIMRIERGPYGEHVGYRCVRNGEIVSIGTSTVSVIEYIEAERFGKVG